MNMSQNFFPAFTYLYPFPSSNQTSFRCTHLSFHFHGLRPIPTSIVVAERRRNKLNSTRQVSECPDVQIEKQRNALIWKETIRDYVTNGIWDKALRMYYQMQRSGIIPDKWVFLSVIKACSSLSDVQAGTKVHEDIIAGGFESDVFVGTALTSMYAKCGKLENARQVFERIPEQNVVSWNAMITGYSQNGQPHEALAFFNEMQVQGIKPNSSTLVNVLPVCADLFALEQGMQIHGYIIRNGFESDIVVGTAIIDMYAKCGYVSIAHKLLERMPKQDVVSWTAIIAGYSQNNHSHEALAVFNKMHVQGVKPNSVTIISVLPACANLLALEQGKQIHGYAIRSGFESNIVVGTALVDMYAKCGNVDIAHKLLERMPKQDVVSWTAIIAGYSQNGHPHKALALFNEMQVQCIKPSSIVIVNVLPACADLLALEQGKQIHGYAIRNGFGSDVVVVNGLVNLYSKCGNVKVAHKLLEKMPEQTVVSWTALIAGYTQNGRPQEALAFFNKMQIQGLKPNLITIVSVLPACANLLVLEHGKQIHCYAIRSGFESDVVVGTAELILPAHRSLRGLADKYGPILFLRLGSVPAVVVSSSETAKEFLKTHDLIFASRPPTAAGRLMFSNSKDVVFAPYGDHWRQMRKICVLELLTAKRIESFKSVREEEVSAMIHSIWEESEKGKMGVNVSKAVSTLTSNIVWRILAGRKFSDHDLGGDFKGFKALMAELTATVGEFNIGDFIPYLDWLDLQGIKRRMKKIHKTFDEFAEKIIDDHVTVNHLQKEAVDAEPNDQDFVDVLLHMAEADTKITRETIKAVVLDLFGAGLDRISIALEWAMSELLRHPRAMKKLKEEIESVVARHWKVKESDLANMKYLHCVVKETLRLYPAAPLAIPHESAQTVTVGGYFIPKKTMLMVNVWAIGRDPKVWGADASEFKPERFMEDEHVNVTDPSNFNMIPFGAGRRGCPGASMAIPTVQFALAQLLHTFDWRVDGDPFHLDMKEACGLTIPRKVPLSAFPKLSSSFPM